MELKIDEYIEKFLFYINSYFQPDCSEVTHPLDKALQERMLKLQKKFGEFELEKKLKVMYILDSMISNEIKDPSNTDLERYLFLGWWISEGSKVQIPFADPEGIRGQSL